MRKNAKRIKFGKKNQEKQPLVIKQAEEHNLAYNFTKDLGVPVILAVAGIALTIMQIDNETIRAEEQKNRRTEQNNDRDCRKNDHI